jgi:hypothetical protein
MKIIDVWAKGYADHTGLSRLTVEDHVDPAVAARKTFGSFARVAGVRPAIAPVVPPVSEAYARMMSQNDNS